MAAMTSLTDNADADLYVPVGIDTSRRVGLSSLRNVAGVVLFVAAVGLCGAAVLGARNPSTGDLIASENGSGGGGRPASEADEAEAAWGPFRERVEAGGWIPYGGSAALPGMTAPAQGWVRLTLSMDFLREAYEKGIPVYDQPDGQLLGYDFGSLGFVPREIAEAPGFDPQAVRLQKYGCDPRVPGCLPGPDR